MRYGHFLFLKTELACVFCCEIHFFFLLQCLGKPWVCGGQISNICNSAQKENVKLGWAKHIPNFTENGQK
jgi:hypothetical protein